MQFQIKQITVHLLNSWLTTREFIIQSDSQLREHLILLRYRKGSPWKTLMVKEEMWEILKFELYCSVIMSSENEIFNVHI